MGVQRWVEAATGVKLWTESFGSDTDEPILLVMGANASAMTWPDEFVQRLVDGGRRVIRYDHRDTGQSTTRDFDQLPYAVADLAADAVAVLDGYEIEAAHVVGLSLGGTITQLLALDQRSRLRAMTVMLTAALDVDFVGNIGRAMRGEPAPDGLPTPRADVLTALATRAEPGADREAELDRRVAEWRLLAGDELPFDANEFRRWEQRDIDHSGTLAKPSAHARATPVPTSRGAELTGISTPTLVVQGMLDPLNPPPHGRHLADQIPGARLLEVPGMGHALPGAVHPVLAEAILTHA
ncbi:MAG TPA: alpha/beta fold hydrolase [Pseudonocardiaceae bacterium]|jgi:10-carbomethoxy-13-deoxycarminomycin esterase/esterase|nr:alpha/beta fold hydrolase [Pseudonocardiaceae bacterium]